jgi:hypothetical protein
MRYLISKELTNSQNSMLLNFAFEYSSAFGVSSFKYHKKDLNQSYFDFFDTVANYKLNEYDFIVPNHYTKGQKFHIFDLNNYTKNIILQQSHIFNWKYPNLPEDLTFYKNKKYWLTSITHEHMIILNTDEKIILDFFEKIDATMRRLY